MSILQGKVLHVETAQDKFSCWMNCRNEPNCTWFSFDLKDDGSCFLLESCIELEENPLFITGHKYCDYSSSTTTSSTTTTLSTTTTPTPFKMSNLSAANQ